MSNHNGTAQPMLCLNGCGFFGTADHRNLCSSCYNEVIKAEQAASATSSSPAPVPSSVDVPPAIAEPVPAAVAPAAVPPPAPEVATRAAVPADLAPSPVQDRSRCAICPKKLRLAQQFACMCGRTFCGQHRYAEAHECTFDYVKRNQTQLRKDNPEVVASKVSKI
ncbi:AN1-type domain-containing protein [Plasmodiophora brassicae]|nr:hypothetical protein PBRA_003102 [Plasmodiophora brassicae]